MNTDIFEKSWDEIYNEQFHKRYGEKTLKQEINECKFFIKCIKKELETLNKMEENNAVSSKQNKN